MIKNKNIKKKLVDKIFILYLHCIYQPIKYWHYEKSNLYSNSLWYNFPL